MSTQTARGGGGGRGGQSGRGGSSKSSYAGGASYTVSDPRKVRFKSFELYKWHHMLQLLAIGLLLLPISDCEVHICRTAFREYIVIPSTPTRHTDRGDYSFTPSSHNSKPMLATCHVAATCNSPQNVTQHSTSLQPISGPPARRFWRKPYTRISTPWLPPFPRSDPNLMLALLATCHEAATCNS